MGWTEWLGVAFGVLLFLLTPFYHKRDGSMNTANDLTTKSISFSQLQDSEQKYGEAREAECQCRVGDDYPGLRSNNS